MTLEQTNKNSVFYTSNVDIMETHDENEHEGSTDIKKADSKDQRNSENASTKRSSGNKEKAHVVEVMKKEQKKAQIKSLNQTHQVQVPLQEQSLPESQSEIPAQSQTQAKVDPEIKAQSQNQQQEVIKTPEDQKEQEHKEVRHQRKEQQVKTQDSLRDLHKENDQKSEQEKEQQQQQHESEQHPEGIEDENQNPINTEVNEESDISQEKDKNIIKKNDNEEALIESSNMVSEKAKQSSLVGSEKLDPGSESVKTEELSKSIESSGTKEKKTVHENEIQNQAEEEEAYSEDFEGEGKQN